jgi:hypothetical protein
VDDMERMLNSLEASVNDVIRNTADGWVPVPAQEILDLRERIAVLSHQASSYLDSTIPIFNSLSRRVILQFDDVNSRLDNCCALLDAIWTAFSSL